jgi:urease accessory protein
MNRNTIPRALVALGATVAATMPADAHVGVGATSSFAAGFMHPLSGLDHLTVMVAVGLWAALKGGRALWLWPASFVGIMLVGAGLGMAQVPLPFVEPGILASVVALGLLVALAVDLPVSAGIAIIGIFALFHGHAHGTEVPENAAGFDYIAGFALATALLHCMGLAVGLGFGMRSRLLARVAGTVCAVIGIGLTTGAF